MDAWKNLDSTGYTTTDELYTNFGTTKKALENWPAFKVDGFAIYTDASPHAGDALIQDVDYALEDIDAVKSTEFGEDIYTKVRMINNTAGDIYITYTAIGSYVPADVFQNMLTPYEPAAKNISAGNQVTDLSIYERGGTSEKWNGWRIKVSWTGGLDAGTYTHLYTGTTYTMGGVALATDNRVGVGAGYHIWELDKTNGDWKLIEDSTEIVSVLYTNSSGVGANTIINFSTKSIDKYNTVTTGASWKWTCPKSGWYLITSSILQGNPAGNMWIYKAGSTYAIGMWIAIGMWGNSAWLRYFAKSDEINIRSDGTTSANAAAWVSIVEQRGL